MKTVRTLLLLCAVVLAACAADIERHDLPPRQPIDRVGYAHSAELFDRLAAKAAELEGEAIEGRASRCWSGGISPHDDFLYAGRVYAHLYPGLKAHTVVIFGVCHKARRFGVEDRLIFDSYPAWRGPYGPVKVSSLRAELLEGLDHELCLISNEIHDTEHSVEGLIPFLQNVNRRVEIVPILVPHMGWERMNDLAATLAGTLGDLMQERGWLPGRDVALLVSNDCVHYGDDGWGGKTYADFGTDRSGYERAVDRDLRLIEENMAGPLSLIGFERLFRNLVSREDHREYAITWCGRYSLPFGMACLFHLHEHLELPQPAGELLRYGTTLDEGELPVADRGPLGVTAPRSLRHWVGFCSIGYE